MARQALKVTWLGHGTFLYESPEGQRILVDPWVEGNPKFPTEWRARIFEKIDVILITHGHFDHITDLMSVAQSTDAQVAGIFDLAGWLASQGLAEDKFTGFNKGGTVDAVGVRVTMVPAQHSSSMTENGKPVYLGEAVGYVLRFADGTCVYHTGDTCVFGDMRIYGELYQPDVAVLPIGDHFTMGPEQAAYAARLIGAPTVIPGHFGTFPLLHGTPEQLQAHLAGSEISVVALEPGSSTQIRRTSKVA